MIGGKFRRGRERDSLFASPFPQIESVCVTSGREGEEEGKGAALTTFPFAPLFLCSFVLFPAHKKAKKQREKRGARI